MMVQPPRRNCLNRHIIKAYSVLLLCLLSVEALGGPYDVTITFEQNLLVSMDTGGQIPKHADLPSKVVEDEEANHDGQSWGRVIWHAHTTPEWWIDFVADRNKEISRLHSLIQKADVAVLSMTFEQALADNRGHEWLMLSADLRRQIAGKNWALSALKDQLNAPAMTPQQRKMIKTVLEAK